MHTNIFLQKALGSASKMQLWCYLNFDRINSCKNHIWTTINYLKQFEISRKKYLHWRNVVAIKLSIIIDVKWEAWSLDYSLNVCIRIIIQFEEVYRKRLSKRIWTQVPPSHGNQSAQFKNKFSSDKYIIVNKNIKVCRLHTDRRKRDLVGSSHMFG